MSGANDGIKKLEVLYTNLRNKYIRLVNHSNQVIQAFNKNRIAFKRLYASYYKLKKKFIILRKYSTQKVMELVEKINTDNYQIVFDEYRTLLKVSDAFLNEVEMERAEFEHSIYVDTLFEKYLPEPDRSAGSTDFPPFHLPVMIKSFDSEGEKIHPFAHFHCTGKCVREKPNGRFLYYLNVEDISSTVELDYFQKTDTLIRSLSISNYSLLGAKKTIEMHKIMLISLTCSLIGEYSRETSQHLKNMQYLSTCLSHECKRRGLVKVEHYDLDEYVKDINYTSVLHDIGKMAVPRRILEKDGKLTDEEIVAVKRHPGIGASYIKRIIDMFEVDPAYSSYCSFLRIPYAICRSHHERWDGGGYPDGLKGEAIPFPARMISVVDTYEALRGVRVYNHVPKSHEATVGIITNESGKQFDPAIVEAFLGISYKFEQAYASPGADGIDGIEPGTSREPGIHVSLASEPEIGA